MNDEISQSEMIADLRAAFPDLMARPVSEFSRDYASQEGVWTGGGEACMADDAPIFWASESADPDLYDGGAHVGFIAWLKRRGWGVERYDGETFLLFPNSHWTA